MPKSLYILALNTFIFCQANGMQLVSNSKKDNRKKMFTVEQSSIIHGLMI